MRAGADAGRRRDPQDEGILDPAEQGMPLIPAGSRSEAPRS